MHKHVNSILLDANHERKLEMEERLLAESMDDIIKLKNRGKPVLNLDKLFKSLESEVERSNILRVSNASATKTKSTKRAKK